MKQDDETRRRKGEFFTPTIWVDEAHKMITEKIGRRSMWYGIGFGHIELLILIYVYKLLYKEGIYEKLSPDAKEVLDMASALVVKSFDMRIALHNEKPELHLNTWDAGWYQIK